MSLFGVVGHIHFAKVANARSLLKMEFIDSFKYATTSAAGPAAPHAKKGVIRFVVLSSFSFFLNGKKS